MVYFRKNDNYEIRDKPSSPTVQAWYEQFNFDSITDDQLYRMWNEIIE